MRPRRDQAVQASFVPRTRSTLSQSPPSVVIQGRRSSQQSDLLHSAHRRRRRSLSVGAVQPLPIVVVVAVLNLLQQAIAKRVSSPWESASSSPWGGLWPCGGIPASRRTTILSNRQQQRRRKQGRGSTNERDEPIGNDEQTTTTKDNPRLQRSLCFCT